VQGPAGHVIAVVAERKNDPFGHSTVSIKGNNKLSTLRVCRKNYDTVAKDKSPGCHVDPTADL